MKLAAYAITALLTAPALATFAIPVQAQQSSDNTSSAGGQPQSQQLHPQTNPSNDQPSAHESTTPSSVGARDSAPTATTASRAQDYVRLMAESDLFEVQSSKLALKKSQDPDVRDFAQKMIAAHTQSTAKLKDTVAKNKIDVRVPDKLVAPQTDMMSKLSSLSGKQFDHAYDSDQTQGHEQALQLQETYEARGDNKALQAFAKQIQPTIQSHLLMARALTQTTVDPQARAQTHDPAK